MLEQHTHSILLVDDDPDNLDTLILYLEDYRFGVFTALNGREGLEAARRDQPSLILLDVIMPRMDGFSVCQQLKIDPLTAHIPVIFLTSSDHEDEKAKGFALGAVDYITKPVRQKELLARVTAHLNQHRLYHNLLQRLDAYQQHFGQLPGEVEEDSLVSERQLKQIYRARELLIEHLENPPTLEELARTVGMNRKKLSDTFHTLYGQPVFEWLREYRLFEARGLLRDSALPVSEIALAVGYGNNANFSTAFKKRFGMTPKQYRQLQSKN